MQPQLGFDFQQLIGIGANIASEIGAGITGSGPAPTYGQTGTTAGFTSSPYFLPVVIGGAVLLYLAIKK